jgi:hypothetical protein
VGAKVLFPENFKKYVCFREALEISKNHIKKERR